MRSDALFEAIRELRQELEDLDHVIRQIEAVEAGRGRRRRPPSALARVKAARGAGPRDTRDNDG